jgi:hypothetical protein
VAQGQQLQGSGDQRREGESAARCSGPLWSPRHRPEASTQDEGCRASAAAQACREATPGSHAARQSRATGTDELRGLTTDDITSFKALGAEVHFKSDTYGDVWLVPAYTDQPRKELTVEHAATIVRVLAAFPGSRVLAFNKSFTNQERPERQHQEQRS